MTQPPPRPPGPSVAIGVFVFSTAVCAIAWLIVGKAGLFSETVPDPPGAVVALVMIAAALASFWFGRGHALHRGWSKPGAFAIAVTSVPVGLVLGVVAVYALAGVS